MHSQAQALSAFINAGSPPEARWENLQKNAKQPTIGLTIDNATDAIEREAKLPGMDETYQQTRDETQAQLGKYYITITHKTRALSRLVKNQLPEYDKEIINAMQL